MRARAATVLMAALLCATACKKKEEQPAAPPAPEQPRAPAGDADAHARALAHRLIIVDGHIDLPDRLHDGLDGKGAITEDPSQRTARGDFDAVRAREGGLDAPFMSIYIPSRYQKSGGARALADQLIDMVVAMAKDHPEVFALATDPAQIDANHRAGLVSLPMGIENGAAIEGDLANLKHFYDRGVRYMTLTHAEDNRICDSSYAGTYTHHGLSDFGKQVVAEMNRLGMMIDISHVSDDTFMQVLALSKAPVIASHSSLRHFTPGFERNVSDEMLRALAANGGIIMINFGSPFVDADSNAEYVKRHQEGKAWAAKQGLDPADPATDRKIDEQQKDLPPIPLTSVSKVADNIQYAVKIAGIDHVGLGSDFDGLGPTLPVGLEDVSRYPALLAELIRRGFSDEELGKICSGNIFRVWRAVKAHAAASPE